MNADESISMHEIETSTWYRLAKKI